MSDKEKKYNAEDEYQFPGDEYVSPDQHTADDTQSAEQQTEEQSPFTANTDAEPMNSGSQSVLGKAMGFYKNLSPQYRKVLIIGVGVVVVLVAFKLMSPSHDTKVISKKPKTVAVKQVQQTNPNQQVMGQLSNAQQESQANTSEISALKSQVKSLSSALNQMTTEQVRSNQAIGALADQIKQLSAEVKAAHQSSHSKAAPQTPKIVFQTKAVIPGRAWIINQYGKTDTVRVGDTLPGYGEVQSINSNTGVITTSSGRTIGYGPTDS